VSIFARGQGAITRVAALTGDDVLMLRDGRDVLLWRSGTASVAYQLHRDDPHASAIADLAVDPDFARNRFVYLAVVTTAPGSSSVRVVRVREAGDTLAEAATIVPDLEIGDQVSPRLTITADRRIYLAIPAATTGSSRGIYDGFLIAFSEDGRSAGMAIGSPLFSRGVDRPAKLEPGAAGLVWLGAADAPADGTLDLIRFSADGSVATTRASDTSAMSDPDAGVLDLVFTGPDRGLLITASRSLYGFRLSADGAVLDRALLDLGAFEPTALATTGSGDVVVAARTAGDPDAVVMLSLHSSSSTITTR
jgi:hypothetical protein